MTTQLPPGGGLNEVTRRRLNGMLANLPVNVRNFGATGDGETDDTAAIQAAIAYCETFGDDQAPELYIPAGTYVISSTLNVTKDGFHIRGAGNTTRLKPTITNSTPCLKIAAGCSMWDLSDFRIEAAINTSNFVTGAANAQACTGLDAYQTGSNFITRFRIRNVTVKGCAKGARLGGFIGQINNLFIHYCEAGLEGTLLNAVEAILRFEFCRKAFSITDSNALHLDNLLDEGALANTVSSTIDNCVGLKITAPYYEGDGSYPRSVPYLTIGGTTECRAVNFEVGSVVSSTNFIAGVYPILLDRVRGVRVSVGGAEGAKPRMIGTTSNTKDYRLEASGQNSNAGYQDDSKQLGVAHNYFPNRSFDLWFRGWSDVTPIRCTLTRETTSVRKGANAVRVTGATGQAQNYVSFVLRGAAVTALRGKSVRIGVWMGVPDIAAYTEGAQTHAPGVYGYSYNGVTLANSQATSGRAVRNASCFIVNDLTIQSDATEIGINVSPNLGLTNCTGVEHIDIQEITLCEASIPLSKQMNGELIDSPLIYSRGEGGRLVAYDAAAPADADQTYEVGDKVWKVDIAAGGSMGWICTTAGAGGTAVFKAMPNVAA